MRWERTKSFLMGLWKVVIVALVNLMVIMMLSGGQAAF